MTPTLEPRVTAECLEDPSRIAIIAMREGMTTGTLIYRLAHSLGEKPFRLVFARWRDVWRDGAK
jgi:hypothetical protein